MVSVTVKINFRLLINVYAKVLADRVLLSKFVTQQNCLH